MAAFRKFVLSFSSNGKQILIGAVTSGSATNIHTPPAGTTSVDEVWLYASNTATSSISCSILWGGTTEPNDVVRTVVPPQAGRLLIVDGKLIQNGLNIQAYSSVANVLIFDGFVNRINN